MRYNIKFLFFLIFICSIASLFLYNTSCKKWVNHNIKYGFNGIIVGKIQVRKGIISHAKIKLKEKDTLVFLNNIEKVAIGDSIKKFANSPFYYYKHNGLWNKQIFETITKDLQSSLCFPKEWKKKCTKEWKEACK
ncbi:hypothetical protein SAMN05421856_105228 [Chryseobacterium taichungense]|uniref:Uncharacterized protein n=1 Tax=Chryseobacterium taichungense TaxID=295069 RepID=A0A1H8AD54_9FLAO|nr:hypothetical protein [Chryseobacterium taichungense]SEM67719.1 hypothetical protein SAMN05421856_105228 [Chryseobacterium taichungense]